MKPKEITMQIVKNIGNYEMARLQATYELTDGEGDTREAIADLFKEARKDLEFAFIRSYGKQSYSRDEDVEDDEEVVETDEVGDITTDKVRLTTKRHLHRVLDALQNGDMTIEYVERNFILTDDQREFFMKKGFYIPIL
jgi:flagellar motor switch protein FliG